jgi:hypothetical protein
MWAIPLMPYKKDMVNLTRIIKNLQQELMIGNINT